MKKEATASIHAIIEYLQNKNIHAAQVNLLPYHNTGSVKYEKIGLTYEGQHLERPSDEEMEHFKSLFITAGFHNTKIGG